jgi:protein SCO1/2
MTRQLAAMLLIIMALPVLAQSPPPPSDEEIGVEEHLGETIPLDLIFKDEDGRDVRLGDLADKPVLLILVYYRCPSICNPLMSGVAEGLDRLDLVAGRDYTMITVSFDDREGPELAKEKKANYLKTFSRPFPPEGWRFLTGDTAAIRSLTGAVGFKYKRDGDDFLHPVTLVAISPQGKIVRYLYGMTFLPFDLKMAVFEAAEGRVGATISKVMLYCFSYDPEGKTYVFNILKVTGTLVLALIACFLLFLVITSKKRKKEKASDVAQ